MGSTAILDCKVSGSMPISTSWYKDGMDVFAGEKHKLTFTDRTATLIILHTNVSDRGNYTCKASNMAGSDTCSAMLMVVGMLQGKTK